LKKEFVADPVKMNWETIKIPGIGIKYLFRNEENGASIALTHFDKGVGIDKPHMHASNQFMYVIKGKFAYPGSLLNPGKCMLI
jgi:quercetin dioxygenase-like cupin family protein